MSEEIQRRSGRCHCGAVQFSAVLSEGLQAPRRCSCSMCRMRGAVVVSAALDGIEITQGEEHLRRYQFNTRTAQHFFCGVCGIYTHHQRRSNPNQFSINVACLEGVSPFDFTEVAVYDGEQHTRDTGRPSVVLGTLIFRPVCS